MNTKETIESIAGRLGTSGSVKSIFGEPTTAHGRTVIPVAKIAYGFGAGGGTGPRKGTADSSEWGEGGGGGGGVAAYPVGALEITETGVRFVPLRDNRWMLGALAAGALLGGLLTRRRR